MKKLASIVAVFLAVLGICFTLSACDDNSVAYNAVVVDSGIEYTAEFLKSSITYRAYYENEDYEYDNPDSVHGWVDYESPKTRTYIIEEQSQADEIFAQSPAFDFENEMVLVYCWTEIYNARPVILKSVKIDNGTLKIQFTLKEPTGEPIGDASMPMRRILVVKIDKLDISTVEFSKT